MTAKVRPRTRCSQALAAPHLQAEVPPLRGVVLPLRVRRRRRHRVKLDLVEKISVNINQLEKLEAAKTASLVCISHT